MRRSTTHRSTGWRPVHPQRLRRDLCDAFKRSPVFRVGGDEFAVICRGSGYDHLDENVVKIEEHNAYGRSSGGIQIAYGAARFDADESAEVVFERADHRMYKCNAQMKGVG